MEFRRLGKSGLNVPVLSYGTATFGGGNEFFKAWGSTDVAEATRLIDVCLDAGLNLFDTANIYSAGAAEEILGKAIAGKQGRVMTSTKSTFKTGEGPNDYGSGRLQIIEECEKSLKRLGVGHIDIYHLHGMDLNTPVEETLRALDDLIKAGKIRYIAASNFSAWHLMKSLATSDREGLSRYVGHQIYYSLVGREAEHELIPLGVDQGVGSIIWSPLAGGALSGKIKRGQAPAKDSRLGQIKFVPYRDENLFQVVDVLETIAAARGKTIPQVALNWLLRKPTVTNIVVGARNEKQLVENFGAIGWKLTPEEVKALDEASQEPAPYPNWHQQGVSELVPPLPSTAQ